MIEPREDPDSRCHSLKRDSVMSYTTIATTLDPDEAQDLWLNWRFDVHDREDLAAHRMVGRLQAPPGSWAPE